MQLIINFFNWLKSLFVQKDGTTEPPADQPKDEPKPAPEPEIKKPQVINKRSTHLSTLRDEYTWLWHSMVIYPEKLGTLDWYKSKIYKYKPKYDSVSTATGLPWWMIGILHSRESSFSFTKHLHNGDSLKRRTVRVPAGRPKGNPPFTWEESAIDALMKKCGDLNIDPHNYDWSRAAECMWYFEAYNGFGYRLYREHLSSYVWNFSKHVPPKGGYPRDGVYDPNYVSKQAGCAPLAKRLGIVLK